VPFMHDRLHALACSSGTYLVSTDPAVIKPDRRASPLFPDREQIAPSPEVVALSLDELPEASSRACPRSFAC
jgi:hypothetical protein